MYNYVLFADSNCDLPYDIIKDLEINYLGLVCNFKGKDYIEDCGRTLSYEEFYNSLRTKAEVPTTSQVNAFRFKQAFKEYVKDGISIIYIAFSSALSGTYNSALLAKEDLLEEYPNADITIIDSKSASCGSGLLVYHAALLRKEGKTKEDVIQWIETNKLKTCHFFTVDNLDHLKRGGRISSTTATIGTLLSIKPILYVNNNGELKNFAKAKGRKKSIKTLLEKLESHIGNPENKTIFISHGDCYDDAKHLANMIVEKYPVNNIIINYIGLVIGAHTGPGVLALFFLGENREP